VIKKKKKKKVNLGGEVGLSIPLVVPVVGHAQLVHHRVQLLAHLGCRVEGVGCKVDHASEREREREGERE